MLSAMNRKFSVVGTDIEEVKRLNHQSGLSYNEVKKVLAEKYMKMNQFKED